MSTSTQLATGLGGAIGCDFRVAQNQLIFVEYASGKLSAINLTPTASTVAQSTSTVLKGTFTFDLDNGVEGGVSATADIFWDQKTAVLRSMDPYNSAKIVNLGAVDFNSLSPAVLKSLTYGTTPIVGNNDPTNKLTVNDVFAVQTTSGNFAKVQVLAYGYDLTIRWTTYKINSGYVVLGTGYNQPEDVKLSTDGVHAYITERSGDLVKVSLSNANRSAATVVCTGLNAPQQLFLDEAHNSAYTVEYAASGNLQKINLTNGSKTAVATGLVQPVGLTLSSDIQFAYVSEQTTGSGRITRIQLSSASKTTVRSGLTSPFFLSWTDSTQAALFVAQRDPSNSIVSVNVTDGTMNTVASGVPVRPSSVVLPHPGQMIICSDSVIEEVSFSTLSITGPLLMGIGLIPYDHTVTAAGPTQGLANTVVDVNPPLLVNNVPFGGQLPVMVNHQAAANAGAAYYQVLVDGTPHTDAWTDYKWNGTANVLMTTTPVTVGSSIGCYPVHPISDLFLWLSPALGDLLDSTSLTNDVHTITLRFLNSSGFQVTSLVSNQMIIRVNNQSCVATLAPATIAGTPPITADPCGVLHYGSNTGATLQLPFTASHPMNYATYSVSLARGVTGVSLVAPATPLPNGAPVSTAVTASPISAPLNQVLGSCPIAGIAVEVYVAATMTNGYGRQSQYDAEALMGLVLTA